MFDSSKVIAIIPARAGSKGLPGKNTLRIQGRSLVEIALQAAVDSKYVDQIILSSDSTEILASDCEVEITRAKRSVNASTDSASAADVLLDLKTEGYLDDVGDDDFFILWLQPTSPLRTSTHIDQAFELLKTSTDSLGLISVSSSPVSPDLMLIEDENGLLIPVSDKRFGVNRQALRPGFMPNGAIYLFRFSEFAKDSDFPRKLLTPYFMSIPESIDIDEEKDYIEAIKVWMQTRR